MDKKRTISLILNYKWLFNTCANFDWLTCSWHQKAKPWIHQFTNLKCCIKAREPFKTHFWWYVIYYVKKVLSLAFSILKALKDILQHFSGFFDVTNRLDMYFRPNALTQMQAKNLVMTFSSGMTILYKLPLKWNEAMQLFL